MPLITSGNTNTPVLMIAEKASEDIIKEYNLKIKIWFYIINNIYIYILFLFDQRY